MPKFKVGDRIQVKNTASFSPNSKGSITDIDGTTYLVLRDGGSSVYFAEKELKLIVEEPKPWLKVTPPQPEKRELQSCSLVGGYRLTVCDCLDRDGYDSVRISEGPYGIDKEKLRELGETLIEISKEMK